MSTLARKALPMVLLCSFAAHAQQWVFQGGKQTNNGSVTVKSVDGSSSQAATQNPTGAAAKVNQTAVTQPPVVAWTSHFAGQTKPVDYGYTAVIESDGRVKIYNQWGLAPVYSSVPNGNGAVSIVYKQSSGGLCEPTYNHTATASPIGYGANGSPPTSWSLTVSQTFYAPASVSCGS